MIVSLESAQRDFLSNEARAAWPTECCGLIEGVAGNGTGLRFHPARNIAADPRDGFEIDPGAQFALMRALRGTERAVIGCYHSHPAGPCAPSPRDMAGAAEEGFLWLILAGGAGTGTFDFAAYMWRDGRFAPVPIAGAA